MPEKHSRISPNTTPFINPLPSNQRLITTYTRPPITPEASPTPMISPKVPPAVISPAMLPFSVATPACSSLTIAKIRIMSRLPMPATKIPAAIPTDGPMSKHSGYPLRGRLHCTWALLRTYGHKSTPFKLHSSRVPLHIPVRRLRQVYLLEQLPEPAFDTTAVQTI